MTQDWSTQQAIKARDDAWYRVRVLRGKLDYANEVLADLEKRNSDLIAACQSVLAWFEEQRQAGNTDVSLESAESQLATALMKGKWL